MKKQFPHHQALAFMLLGLALPAVAADNRCDFATKRLGGATELSIGFPILDPSSGATFTVPVVAASLNAGRIGDCVSSVSMTLSGDNGANFSGGRRMKHATLAEFIPYSLAGIPTSQPGPGNSQYVSFTFTGTVTGPDYANAPAGSYSDNVLISVDP